MTAASTLAVANGDVPTPLELVARAEALAPLLRERAAQTEADRRISDEVARKLIESGFFNIVMPEQSGGYGMSPSVLWQVARKVGQACASTGWILGLIGISPWLVGLFSERAQRDVNDSGNPIVPVMTGGVGREMHVEAVAGGFHVSGQWHYGSGIDLCRWAVVMAPVPGADGQAPDNCLFLVEHSDFEIDHSSWNVMGMRGTGSKTVRLARAFVPSHRSISWTAAQQGDFPGRAVNKDASYRIPVNALFAMSVAAPIAGAAAGAVENVISVLGNRIRSGVGRPQNSENFTQVELGSHVAMIDMAFSLLLSDADEMFERANAGLDFTILERARYRAHFSAVSTTVLNASDRLFALVGGGLIQQGSLVERSFRDLHSMTTHFLMQPDITGEMYGRALLGLDLPPGARV